MTNPVNPEKPAEPTYAPRPAWVKWLLIAALVVLPIVVVALLAGGEHGPGRHLSGLGAPTGASTALAAAAPAAA